jgi:hypothetical protein
MLLNVELSSHRNSVANSFLNAFNLSSVTNGEACGRMGGCGGIINTAGGVDDDTNGG